jgi:hypothetical protein
MEQLYRVEHLLAIRLMLGLNMCAIDGRWCSFCCHVMMTCGRAASAPCALQRRQSPKHGLQSMLSSLSMFFLGLEQFCEIYYMLQLLCW